MHVGARSGWGQRVGEEQACWASSLVVGAGVSWWAVQPASPDKPDPRLDRIPLHKFTSIRRTMSEAMGPVEHLIAKGPISKYATGEPAVRHEPVPELLRNYMDVSVGDGEAAWGRGQRVDCPQRCGQELVP